MDVESLLSSLAYAVLKELRGAGHWVTSLQSGAPYTPGKCLDVEVGQTVYTYIDEEGLVKPVTCVAKVKGIPYCVCPHGRSRGPALDPIEAIVYALSPEDAAELYRDEIEMAIKYVTEQSPRMDVLVALLNKEDKPG